MEPSQPAAAVPAPRDAARTRRWAMGLARLTGAAMILLGILNMILGTGALIPGASPPTGIEQVILVGGRTGGVAQILLGALVGLAGMAVIAGLRWGRLVGIIMTCASLGIAYVLLPNDPVAFALGLVLGVATLWALCVFNQQASAVSPTMLG